MWHRCCWFIARQSHTFTYFNVASCSLIICDAQNWTSSSSEVAAIYTVPLTSLQVGGAWVSLMWACKAPEMVVTEMGVQSGGVGRQGRHLSSVPQLRHFMVVPIILIHNSSPFFIGICDKILHRPIPRPIRDVCLPASLQLGRILTDPTWFTSHGSLTTSMS